MMKPADKCRITPAPKSLKEFFRSWFLWKPVIAILIGGIAGFLFYYFIGCTSGSCAITSDPYGSVITGSLLGFLIVASPCTRC